MTKFQLETVMWLIHGETGLSSKTMAAWLAFGTAFEGGGNYPHDPDDFDRCLGYLQAAPEARNLLPALACLSPIWGALVERWDEIERSHLEEVGLGWAKSQSAPKTYKLMREVIDRAMVAA